MAPTRMKLRVRRRDNAAAGTTAGGGPVDGEAERSRESRRSSKRKNSNKAAATTTTADASSPPPTSSATARAAMAAEASPDSKCPICLDRFNNLAYLDRCLHRFCFPCIQEWSHNKAECPLCKQPFASILHSVRAEDDFKEYLLRPAPPTGSVAATVAMVAAMASAARSDHHMRLMLRRHRVSDGGETAATTRRRRRRERGVEGTEERTGMWEWYLDPPPLPLPPLPQHPTVSNAEDSEEEELGTRPERGVIFEGLTGLGGPSLAPTDRVSRRLMTRLAARQRLQREGGTVRRLREREMLAFRRALYRCGIRVHGVAGAIGSQGQQQRDITADGFRLNPANLNRLRPWLRRELTVLYGAHGSLVDIVQRIIMARLARHGLEDSPTAEDELRPFLLARTEHFLHELVSFARSPLSLEAYDLQAAYEPPPAATTLDLDGFSSSDGSSVIAISEGEDGREDGGIRAGSHSGWDDEAPGPSCAASELPCSEPTNDEAEEECLIVGYKKPIAERTPELVQLSSDSEEDKKDEEEKTEVAPPPSPAPTSSPAPPPSTSAAVIEQQEVAPKNGTVWSGSSVCSLSPAMAEQLDERTSSREMMRRRRRRRRKKRRKEDQGRSGVLANPNRSIYPPMMRRRSPSPFHSSADSGSPDSSWDLHQISPLTSSQSSPSHYCSSSPLYSPPPPPPRTPPALSAEKPGGKRKYKSRHLDSDAKDPAWTPGGERKREGGRRKTRERLRREGPRENGGSGGDSRRTREDRSPSVEIVYEGTVISNATQPPARRRRRRTRRSRSPVIITLDSDSSHDDINISGSSSPLSSQQTVDFSDLPPLPLATSAGVGGALDADVGELPVDILDRGSDGSESEPAGRIDMRSDDSDVDVVKDDGAALATKRVGEKTPPSDTSLLATILSDLNQISAPRDKTRFFPETRTQNRSELQNQSFVPFPPPLDVPPVLKRASPVQPYDRNTPPPLKHKDARSPRRTADPVPADLDVLLAQPTNNRTIPPITALKKHFPKPTSAGYSCLDQNPPSGPGFSCSDQNLPSGPGNSCSDQNPPSGPGLSCLDQNPPSGPRLSCLDQNPPSGPRLSCLDQNPPSGPRLSCLDQNPPSGPRLSCLDQKPPSGPGFSCSDQNPPSNPSSDHLTQVDLCSFPSPEFCLIHETGSSHKSGSQGPLHADSTSPNKLHPPNKLRPPAALGGGGFSGDSDVSKPVFVSPGLGNPGSPELMDLLSSSVLDRRIDGGTSAEVGPVPALVLPDRCLNRVDLGPETRVPQTSTDSFKPPLRDLQTLSDHHSTREPRSAETRADSPTEADQDQDQNSNAAEMI